MIQIQFSFSSRFKHCTLWSFEPPDETSTNSMTIQLKPVEEYFCEVLFIKESDLWACERSCLENITV